MAVPEARSASGRTRGGVWADSGPLAPPVLAPTTILCYQHYRTFEDRLGEFINCSNPRCYNGGSNIGEILRGMVGQRSTSYRDARIPCQGYEGSPKGRRKYGMCMNVFRVEVTITYRPEAEGPVV